MTPSWLEPLLIQGRTRSLSAQSWLLRQGEAQPLFYYLHEGIARAVWHSENGTERIKEFYFPGECCFLYLNWLTETTADYGLQLLTAARISEIPLRLLDEPAHQPAKIALMRQQLIYKEKKEQMLLLNNPGQRYRYMQLHFPDWESRLTQKDLAAWIGISPVSLSRIRARLNKG
ncbi:MAG TPA: Crp/Fnr family transcriptional regulator [Enterobacteriaceae bacterium]|nr:Crp/Fnr family transcriptional regulator [Enterobacteriaceae bacterium]